MPTNFIIDIGDVTSRETGNKTYEKEKDIKEVVMTREREKRRTVDVSDTMRSAMLLAPRRLPAGACCCARRGAAVTENSGSKTCNIF